MSRHKTTAKTTVSHLFAGCFLVDHYNSSAELQVQNEQSMPAECAKWHTYQQHRYECCVFSYVVEQ